MLCCFASFFAIGACITVTWAGAGLDLSSDNFFKEGNKSQLFREFENYLLLGDFYSSEC